MDTDNSTATSQGGSISHHFTSTTQGARVRAPRLSHRPDRRTEPSSAAPYRMTLCTVSDATTVDIKNGSLQRVTETPVSSERTCGCLSGLAVSSGGRQ